MITRGHKSPLCLLICVFTRNSKDKTLYVNNSITLALKRQGKHIKKRLHYLSILCLQPDVIIKPFGCKQYGIIT